MVKLDTADVRIAAARKLKFSINVKEKPDHHWSAVCKDLGLKEAFMQLTGMNESYYEKGVFVETDKGSLKYWSSESSDLFNSMVLLV